MFKSTRGDLLDAGVANGVGAAGRTIDAGVAESGLSPEDELEDGGVKNGRDEADDDDDAEGNNGGGAGGVAVGGFKSSLWSLITFP